YSRLPSVLNVASAFAGMLVSRLRQRFWQGAPSSSRSGDHAADQVPPLDAAVLFFPHKGPMYGRLYAKDHFYSADSGSSLSKARICHVEMASTLGVSEAFEVLESYRERGIVPYLLEVKRVPRSLRGWLTASICGARMGLRPMAAFLVELALRRVQQGVAALTTFKNAKLALLGYEAQFPVWLTYALQVRNVRVVATQERFIHSMLPNWTL